MGKIDFTDQYFMQQALRQAKEALAKDEVPVGAVVVSEGTLIAGAHNMTETLNDVTAHAEMLAITAASEQLGSKYLPNCTLYVTLEPCAMCAGALNWAQIGRIVIGAKDEKRGYQRLTPSPIHPRTDVTEGILEAECQQLLKQFFATKR
ncbi:nucleoside deaminase [Thermophagus sp. OGC60D27]|uniref:nucleoside deaminase n=1 Tax=Thermophagus sp. OGC60D27 TaxID=3458415 RepID=UPI004037A02F